jgi:hypothetical protein
LIVARSTAKAEYKVMALGVAEILWLKRLLEDLKINHRAKIKLWCDSKSTVSAILCSMIEPSM